MLGNHDLVRFGDLIERAGKGGPSTFGYWARHRMAFTFMAAWSGPITLYYGEEVGAEVAGFSAKVTTDCARTNQCDDHVSRNMVSIGGLNARTNSTPQEGRALKDFLATLMTLRGATPALSSGSRTHIFSNNDVYIDLKSDGTNKYALVMNFGVNQRIATLAPQALGFTDTVTAQTLTGTVTSEVAGRDLKLTLPPLSAAILKLEGR
jgi:cyclomaltodextrinase / maltogenic alpha-amylase / neopullulanase